MAPEQIPFDLPHREALGREDFLVSPANEAAVAQIDRWPDWLAHGLLLIGPAGSGKSHLAEVWRQRARASRHAASSLTVAEVPAVLASGAAVIEDAAQGCDERALFHLLNLAREQKASLLITARSHPLAWGLAIPDLLSRLKALPIASLGEPDDALLRGVLVKLFADRQIAIDEAALSLMLARMERSLGAARDLVAEIDRRAMIEKAEVSRPFIARVLSGWQEPGLFGED